MLQCVWFCKIEQDARFLITGVALQGRWFSLRESERRINLREHGPLSSCRQRGLTQDCSICRMERKGGERSIGFLLLVPETNGLKDIVAYACCCGIQRSYLNIEMCTVNDIDTEQWDEKRNHSA